MNRRRLVRKALGALLTVGLAFAISYNVVEFRAIDRVAPRYRAWWTSSQPTLIGDAMLEDGIQQRFGPFIHMGRLFPDSTIIVPPEGISSNIPFNEGMMSFGNARAIVPYGYDPTAVEAVDDLASFELDLVELFAYDADQFAGLVNRTSIFVLDSDASRFIVSLPNGQPGRGGPINFVDLRLVPNLGPEQLDVLLDRIERTASGD